MTDIHTPLTIRRFSHQPTPYHAMLHNVPIIVIGEYGVAGSPDIGAACKRPEGSKNWPWTTDSFSTLKINISPVPYSAAITK